MTKTKETLALEDALDAQSEKEGRYGCREVTIGFESSGHGDEIVDYMSMDSRGMLRCYEIKVTMSDLKSHNRKSWYGDYNYLVVSENLYHRMTDIDELVPEGIGILAGTSLKVCRKASRTAMKPDTQKMLEDSLLRSLYWRMRQNMHADNVDEMKEMQKQLALLQKEYEAYRQKVDRDAWTLADYERYYAMNHQLSSFYIAQDGRVQRSQYMARKKNEMAWIPEDGAFVCPVCGRKVHSAEGFDYCPFCGTDLRSFEK
ncbi:MAG: hypothetical protein VZT48_11445 [Bulleidia sp.]|nr:hypothetical protein [Bulleidia sp.]